MTPTARRGLRSTSVGRRPLALVALEEGPAVQVVQAVQAVRL